LAFYHLRVLYGSGQNAGKANLSAGQGGCKVRAWRGRVPFPERVQDFALALFSSPNSLTKQLPQDILFIIQYDESGGHVNSILAYRLFFRPLRSEHPDNS
jgi:hypothetical protein